MPTALHFWKNLTSDEKESEVQEFNLSLWIEKNDKTEVREFVSKELVGSITTPGFGTPPPSDYYEKAHIYVTANMDFQLV